MTISRNKLIIVVLVILIASLWSVFSNKGVRGLDGDFQEVAMARNENNTGPIQRVYAVTVSDTLWDEMRKYGDLMLYTKFGNTKVYFFKTGKRAPQELNLGDINFDTEFNRDCLAKYEKNASGLVTLTRYPFK